MFVCLVRILGLSSELTEAVKAYEVSTLWAPDDLDGFFGIVAKTILIYFFEKEPLNRRPMKEKKETR